MFSSLRARLWLTYAMLIMVALGVLAAILIVYLVENPLANRQALIRLRTLDDVVLSSHPWTTLSGEALQAAVAQTAQAYNVRIAIYGTDQRPLADSSGRTAGVAFPRFPRLRTSSIVRDGQGQVWMYVLSSLGNGEWLMVASPRERVAVFAIFRDDFFMPLIFAGSAALVLSLALGYGMARWVADPLQNLVQVSRSVPAVLGSRSASRGERSGPQMRAGGTAGGGELRAVPVRGPREVQELTAAFNEMLSRLQAGQRSQRDFVANVSHELKTPLTSIQGFAQALMDGAAATPEAQRQAAGIIYNEAGRMHRLVTGLLDLARLDAGIADLQRAPVDMPGLLRSVAERFAPQAARANVTLSVEASGLPAVIGDGDRLAQLFTNLVDNALKHTAAGGHVTLRGTSLAEGVQIAVEDNGAGIPARDLEHIFERFYQADPSRSGGEGHGAGLGLAIVREIVHAHGGKITVRSTPGQGSIFLVLLPLDSQTAQTQSRRKK